MPREESYRRCRGRGCKNGQNKQNMETKGHGNKERNCQRRVMLESCEAKWETRELTEYDSKVTDSYFSGTVSRDPGCRIAVVFQRRAWRRVVATASVADGNDVDQPWPL